MVSIRYIQLFIFFLIILISGCQKDEDKLDLNGMEFQINRYYENLGDEMDSNRSYSTIEFKEPETRIALHSMNSYLLKKGYRVVKIAEPDFLYYEEPFAVYEIEISVTYPLDFLSPDISQRISHIERIWVNANNLRISKIRSTDPWVMSRMYPAEYIMDY